MDVDLHSIIKEKDHLLIIINQMDVVHSLDSFSTKIFSVLIIIELLII